MKSAAVLLVLSIAPAVLQGCATYGASGSYPEKLRYIQSRYGSNSDQTMKDFNACTTELNSSEAKKYNSSGKGALTALVGPEVMHAADSDAPPTVADVMTPGSKAQAAVDVCMLSKHYELTDAAKAVLPQSTKQTADAKPAATKASSPISAAPDQAARTPAAAGQSASDVAQRLEKLKGLRDQGLITQDEYNRKRKEILDSM